MNKKQLMSVNNIQRKEFNYVLGNIKLNFTLRTDVKAEMKGFKELMERAIKDLDEELAKVGKEV